jgi:hypothetical protein
MKVIQAMLMVLLGFMALQGQDKVSVCLALF